MFKCNEKVIYDTEIPEGEEVSNFLNKAHLNILSKQGKSLLGSESWVESL